MYVWVFVCVWCTIFYTGMSETGMYFVTSSFQIYWRTSRSERMKKSDLCMRNERGMSLSELCRYSCDRRKHKSYTSFFSLSPLSELNVSVPYLKTSTWRWRQYMVPNVWLVFENLGSKLGYDTEYSEVFALFLSFLGKCVYRNLILQLFQSLLKAISLSQHSTINNRWSW